jgi:hypothetical protein
MTYEISKSYLNGESHILGAAMLDDVARGISSGASGPKTHFSLYLWRKQK